MASSVAQTGADSHHAVDLELQKTSFDWSRVFAKRRPLAAALRLAARDRCGVVPHRAKGAKRFAALPWLFTAGALSKRLADYGLNVSTQKIRGFWGKDGLESQW